jgi:hypothetical protein
LTTSAVGVGSDYLSQAHQAYVQLYKVLLNYYVLKNDNWSLRTSIAPQMAVELTDSNSTTTEREPNLIDTPANFVAMYTLSKNEKALTSTHVTGNMTVILPTSEASRNSGHYLTLSPRAGLIQKLPLFGASAPALKSIGIRGGVRWDHLFSEANTEVNDDLNVPGQDLSGNALQSDLLGGGRLAPNKLRATGVIEFEEMLFGKHFDIGITSFYESARLYGVQSSTVQLATGPYEVNPSPDARDARPAFGLTVAVGYVPTPELEIMLGYENEVDLGSEENNMFYTPRSVFLAALSLSFDALYLRLNGEPEAEPTFIPF